MNKDDLKTMYGSIPQSFRARMTQTLANGCEKTSSSSNRLRAGLAAALILIALAAVAMAAFSSQVAEFFGQFHGGAQKEKLLTGSVAQPSQSLRLGDVLYTLDEVVYIDDGLYGIGRIAPVDNAKVVLMPEDYSPSDAAGYGLHFGEESHAPEGALTYAEATAEKGAKLMLAKAAAEAVGVDGGELLEPISVSHTNLPQRDGSILFAFELPTGIAVEEGEVFAIRLWVSSWEVAPDGRWLCEEPNNTYLGEEWTVMVQPKPSKEERR